MYDCPKEQILLIHIVHWLDKYNKIRTVHNSKF